MRNVDIARKVHLAALSWLVRHGYEDRTCAYALRDIRDLVTEDNVKRAVRRYAERARLSDVLHDPEKTSSACTYLSNLAVFARRALVTRTSPGR